MKEKKCDAILPVRVTGTRLYGKPLQLLDIENRVTILEYLVKYIKESNLIQDICLAIADSKANYVFADLAEEKGWEYIFGDEIDVLGRMLKAADKIGTDIIFRGSTESPFLFNEDLDHLIEKHIEGDYDLSKYSALPEGSSYSLNSILALKISHEKGTSRHRSELINSYIYDFQDQFKIYVEDPPEKLKRSEVRITVDYPEDLVFCRIVYKALDGYNKLIKISDIVDFWDKNPDIRKPMEEIGIDWGHGRLWK
jgi:spore coat polysaccharide biosynthesis protein SpsF